VIAMSYYRAALAAANMGDLTNAAHLTQCSLALGEDTPSAAYLLELINHQDMIDAKALKVKLPQTSKAHTIRGLLYAKIGRARRAREEFALALTLDTGNELAKRALATRGK
jgi:tetratricopeptide (TPR) repeat protein